MINGASHIKRRRATKAEMGERAAFLIDYATKHRPVTVRGLFYAATVAGIPGIEKDENGYNKIQQQVLELRREGRLPYNAITDGSRLVQRVNAHNKIEDALTETAQFYRRALWRDAGVRPEVWIEKDALGGVIWPVLRKWQVPMYATRGYTSETFAYDAVLSHAQNNSEDTLHVLSLYDFDRSGQDAKRSLQEKLYRFADQYRVGVVFEEVALNDWLVQEWSLPTRAPKRKTTADRAWPYDYACELDAIPPDRLRALVEEYIKDLVDPHALEQNEKIEADERRQWLQAFGGAA